MSKEQDPIEELRRILGIKTEEPVTAGTGDDPQLTWWEQRQKDHEAEMQFLAEGGDNRGGLEQLTKAFRRAGRG